MKQIIIQKGIPVICDVPAPVASHGMIVVRNLYSVISTGTESASVNFSKKSLLQKVFTEREKMEKGFKMLKEKGFEHTYQFIKGMLDFGVEVGYSSCGEIVEIGEGVSGFSIGDRVACAGAQYAHHAEFIAVPVNMCAKVPAGVDSREAASATLGAIALQGVRQAGLSVGESAVVVGLGLLGQLAVQMLVHSGVIVYGADIDDARIDLARKRGMKEGFRADDPDLSKKILMRTGGFGVDAALLYASTPSSKPLNTAFEYTRKRGKVVVIGSVGLSLNRTPWYEKEIDVRISTSYGPGRYDRAYERDGYDYPYAYVRWTQQRNIEAYLSMLSEKKVVFSDLIQKEFDISRAAEAYQALKDRPFALVFRYDPNSQELVRKYTLVSATQKQGAISLGVIGLGVFTLGVRLPTISGMKYQFFIRALATHNAAQARHYGVQYKAAYVTTDYLEILRDPAIDAVLISTRHESHARIADAALQSGKHVFVEKPLALTVEEVERVMKSAAEAKKIFMVGYNRRYSPYVSELKKRLQKRTHPLMILYRVNAGYLPPDHWTQTSEGGGRIIGESCHMLDVFQYLIGAKALSHTIRSLKPHAYYQASDNFSASIAYADGSLATLVYTALGNSSLPKEYIEVYCDGVVYVVDDFRSVTAYGTSLRLHGAHNKGHREILETFASAVRSGSLPVSLEDLSDVARLSISLQRLIA